MTVAMTPALLLLGALSAQAQDLPVEPIPPTAAESPVAPQPVAVSDAAPATEASSPLHPEPPALAARLSVVEARLAAVEASLARPIEPITAPAEASPVDWGAIDGDAREIAVGEEVADAVALRGPIHVRGIVLGDAVALGGDIRVLSGGRVLGDAVSVGGEVTVEPGGEVLGDRVALSGSSVVPGQTLDREGDGLVARAARRLASLLSLAAAGVLILAFWPRHIARIADTARDRPIWHGLAGVILTGVLGTGAGVLTLTILGIPIALGLVLLLGVAWLLGFVAVCLAIGQRLPGGDGERAPWVTFLGGAAVVGLVSLLPVIGPVFIVVVGLEAVGAALVSRLGNRGDPDAW